MELVNPGAANSESNPYILDTCETFIKFMETTSDIYGKLYNDLDFNEMGDDWLSYSIGTASYYKNVDLNGFVIKNILMKPNAINLFVGKNSLIHDGKIVNIYANNNLKFFEKIDFKNVSLTIDATSCKNQLFNYCNFENCTLYIKSEILNYNMSTYTKFLNCYLKLEIEDVNNFFLFNNGSASVVDAQDCKIDGILKGEINSLSYGLIKNSVIDLDMEEINENSNSLFGGNDSLISTGVINISKISNDIISKVNSSLLQANSEQIKNPTWLINNGFEVYPSVLTKEEIDMLREVI